MSLLSAMITAVTALNAQSKQISSIATNLSNSSTTGYKAVESDFESMLQDSSGTSNYISGGVGAISRQDVTAQGTIESTSDSTNLAIDGAGMFVVSDANGNLAYTRDGSFTEDSDGYLTLDSYTLMGWATDSSGNITSSTLEKIDIDATTSAASPTTSISLEANLPSDASSGDSFTTTFTVYDSLGEEQEIPATWTKSSATDEWTLSLSDPTDSSGDSTTGSLSGTTDYTIDFNSDGSLASITDASGSTVSDATISVGSWTDGAGSSTISLDLGTTGESDGLTQTASGSSTPTIDIEKMTTDGSARSSVESVSIGSDGTVTVNYANGSSKAIAKVAMATFANEDGLSADGDVYEQTAASGAATLTTAGSGGAGTIESSALEESTVDTSEQFSLMIQAQQAYSAASQILNTANSMYTSLLQAVRS